MQLELYKPTKPYIETQRWGVYDKRYEQFGFAAHNGADSKIEDKITIGLAPFDCFVYRMGYQPNGGGLFVGLMSHNIYTFSDGVSCRVLIDFLHLSHTLVGAGQHLLVGDDIAVCDNTGAASTGPHLHIQYRRVRYDGVSTTNVDSNNANNSFDPTPFWSTKIAFAADFKVARQLLEKSKEAVVIVPKLTDDEQKGVLNTLKDILEKLIAWTIKGR